MNTFVCGCEMGEDCTKTTMCHVQSAIEDRDEQLDRIRDITSLDIMSFSMITRIKIVLEDKL